MKQQTTCPNCKRDVHYYDSQAGRLVQCPHCSKPFDLPSRRVDFESAVEDELAGKAKPAPVATTEKPASSGQDLARAIRLAILEAHREARQAGSPGAVDSFAPFIFGVMAFFVYIFLVISIIAAFFSLIAWAQSDASASLTLLAYWMGSCISLAMMLCLLEIESHLRHLRQRG